MLRRIAKPALWLMTSAIPVFIAACYGTAYNEPEALSGTVKNNLGQGISNILVTCFGKQGVERDSTYTAGGDGAFYLEIQDADACTTLRFDDVDGAENGAYQSTSVAVDESDLNIVLQDAE